MTNVGDLKRRVNEKIDGLKDELVAMSLQIHGHPEIAFEEERAALLLSDYLERGGFTLERGICQMPTAFRASYGKGRPRVAFLSEYDALPGLGHGCGHNIIGTASAAAGLATKAVLGATGGSVIVIGTPAEEEAGGKAYMVARGAFDDLDCAMLAHPGNRDIAVTYALACIELLVAYHGRASHAAARPEAGLNALDAMITAFTSLGLLRQQLRSSARVHGIITDGGKAVNVIPDYTSASLLLRAEEDDYLEEVRERVLACFRSGAEASGCRLEFRWGEEGRYMIMRTNPSLAEAYARNAKSLGREIEEGNPRRPMGSTDMGNVSAIVPAIHPTIAIAPQDIAIHTEEFREMAAADSGHRGLIDSAKAMAMTAIDVLVDENLRQRMAEEFRQTEGS